MPCTWVFGWCCPLLGYDICSYKLSISAASRLWWDSALFRLLLLLLLPLSFCPACAVLFISIAVVFVAHTHLALMRHLPCLFPLLIPLLPPDRGAAAGNDARRQTSGAGAGRPPVPRPATAEPAAPARPQRERGSGSWEQTCNTPCPYLGSRRAACAGLGG